MNMKILMKQLLSEKKIFVASLVGNLILMGLFLFDLKKGSLLFPNSDFEDGNLKNWTAAGEAFLGQPVKTKVAEKRKGRKFYGVGKYSVGTFEKTEKRQVGDYAKGELLSVPFKITGSRILFKMGGGDNTAQTSVQLLIDDKTVLEERGRGVITQVEAMVPIEWEVSKWKGQMARIKIVDLSSRGWGHINADDFRMR